MIFFLCSAVPQNPWETLSINYPVLIMIEASIIQVWQFNSFKIIYISKYSIEMRVNLLSICFSLEGTELLKGKLLITNF